MAPRAAEIFLVVVLALLSAKLVWLVVEPLPTPVGDTVQAQASATAQLIEPARNPFPAQALAVISEGAPSADVEETTLDLTLTGVWTDDDQGSATIKLPSGEQARFVIGDTVVPGVTLDAVYSNQVTLLRNGVREALKFEKKLSTAVVNRPAQMRPGQSAGAIARATPEALSEIIRLAPASDGKGGLAVELYASRNRAGFNALGFKEGDRLVSVNGVNAPTDASRLSALLGQVQRAKSAKIVVERNGEQVTLDVSLASSGVIQ